MPAPLAKGIIIAASVLVAAGIAAYNENPEFREWLERSRRKIAVAFESFGHDGRPQRPRPNVRSMSEDQDEEAEERRRQARQEILEKGRLLQERTKRRKLSSQSGSFNEKHSTSFDTLVDEEGNLRSPTDKTVGNSSGIETSNTDGTIRPRHPEQQQQQPSNLHHSVDAPIQLRQMNNPIIPSTDPWESHYEQEMRNTWNIPLPEREALAASSSHASESLIDLTPTTEDFPDPEVSIPSLSDAGGRPLSRTEYFSIPPSSRSHTMSDMDTDSEYYHARPDQPLQNLEPRPYTGEQLVAPISLGGSLVGSHGLGRSMEFDGDSDDSSEFGDGVRTPASAWTEVGSTVSGDA